VLDKPVQDFGLGWERYAYAVDERHRLTARTMSTHGTCRHRAMAG
jgi:hypothetical protein